MSVACSIPRINLPTSSLSPPTSSPPASSSSSSSTSVHHFFRSVAIRCSQPDNPLRKLVVSPLRVPSTLVPITPPPCPSPPMEATTAVSAKDKNVIMLEFQRLQAKELQDYFRQKKVEEANQGPFFGFIRKNEIANGR